MSSNVKKVAIIVPTLNEEKHIGNLIDSLNKNTYQNKEIIVVDDGSNDKTLDIAKEKNATILTNKERHRGPAFRRNRGANYTDADILCFLDADNFADDRYFLETAVNAFVNNVVAVRTAYKTKQDTLIEKVLTKKEGITFEPRFIRKDVFLEIGGYPEIGVGEDVIYIRKVRDYLLKNKLKEKVITDTFFSVHGVHSLGEMYRQSIWYGKTSIPFLKEFSGKDRLIHFFIFYSRVFYFLSFLSLFLIRMSKLFIATAIPFFVGLSYIILKGLGNKYNIGKLGLFLIYGLGMLHGLMIFLLRIDTQIGGR